VPTLPAINDWLKGRQPAPDRPADTPPAQPPDRKPAKAPALAVAVASPPPEPLPAAARPAWVDPYIIRSASDGFDEVLDFTNWVLHIIEGALCDEPDPAGADAWLFAGAVLVRLGRLRDMPQLAAVHRAVNLGDAATAQALEAAIRQHNGRGLTLPDHLREYLATREETGADYTRPRRGRSPWPLAPRDAALAREAYDWRLIHHDWRKAHPDLSAPAACLHWTANRLTADLDRIAKTCGNWQTPGKKSPHFSPSDALCRAYGLPVGDDQDALLHRIYPQHFRGLLIGHVAALCLDEWARRMADGPEAV
jgi:hypothetical protein